MPSAVITLKLTSEQYRNLRKEVEMLVEDLSEEQKSLTPGNQDWQEISGRLLELDLLLRNAL
jgi:hypothetical protein